MSARTVALQSIPNSLSSFVPPSIACATRRVSSVNVLAWKGGAEVWMGLPNAEPETTLLTWAYRTGEMGIFDVIMKHWDHKTETDARHEGGK